MNEQQQPKPITITFPDGQTMSKIVNTIVRQRPEGWSRKAYAGYYKEQYGEWMKNVLDDMHDRQVSKLLPYANFPDLKRNSLYLLINQSMLYVLENMETSDMKYKRLTDRIKIDRTDPRGIQLMLQEAMTGKAEDVVPKVEKPKWKEKMEKWLDDNDDPMPFVQSNLLLTPQERDQLILEVSGLSNVMYSITCREIKLIKQ